MYMGANAKNKGDVSMLTGLVGRSWSFIWKKRSSWILKMIRRAVCM